MKTMSKIGIGAASVAAIAFSAAPASAQYYDYRDYRDPSVSVGQVVAGVAAVGAAVAAATHQGRYYGDPYYGQRGYGYGYRDRGFERHAVNACVYEAQRRYSRYGAVNARVRDVQYLRNGRIRVLGAIDQGRFDRWSRYGRFQNRAFTCEVRPRDGRVASFRTHNYRW
jgi:hypothetical protein